MTHMTLVPHPGKLAVHTDADRLAAATGWRKIIWAAAARDEDERIDRLTDICVRLCDGDVGRGRELAQLAVWAPR